MYLSLYCKGSKRVTQGFTVRGSWRPNRTAIYWPPLLWPSALCLSRSPEPEAQGLSFLLSAGFLYHILSATSLDPNSSGPQEPPPPGFLYHIFFSNSSNLQLIRLLVLTELYNSSAPTQSPTQSLEWHVWSSSSGNNCHAVHRSLSSGASVYECTIGYFFYLVPFHQPNPAYAISFDYWPLGCVTSFRCITLEWHICPGRRSKYNSN